MSKGSGARKAWGQATKLAHRRGTLAVGALLITAIIRVYGAAIAAWQISMLGDAHRGLIDRPALELSDTLFTAGAVAEIGMLLVTGVLFLRWLAQAVRTAQALQVVPYLGWTPSQAVWGFFIPFVNLTRPYKVLRDLHDRLDPEGVPEPAPRPRLDGAAGYRTVEVVRPPPPARLPHASIGAWWGLYLVGGMVERMLNGRSVGESLETNRSLVIVADIIDVASATLAIFMVLAISARLVERNRRLRHASDEELESWGIEP